MSESRFLIFNSRTAVHLIVDRYNSWCAVGTVSFSNRIVFLVGTRIAYPFIVININFQFTCTYIKERLVNIPLNKQQLSYPVSIHDTILGTLSNNLACSTRLGIRKHKIRIQNSRSI